MGKNNKGRNRGKKPVVVTEPVNKPFFKFSPHDESVISNILAQASIANLGYDPNQEYTVPPTTFPEMLGSVRGQIMKLQKDVFFVDESVVNELVSCKKYIYRACIFPIGQPVSKTPNGKSYGYERRYYMVGKTSKGYVPFMFCATQQKNIGNDFLKYCSAAQLKGEDYFVISRVDTGGEEHVNKLLSAKGHLASNRNEMRLNPYLPHRHFYSPKVMCYIFRQQYGLMSAESAKMLMNSRELMKLDAKEIDTSINTLKQLICFGSNVLNFECVAPYEGETLGEFYEKCKKRENELKTEPLNLEKPNYLKRSIFLDYLEKNYDKSLSQDNNFRKKNEKVGKQKIKKQSDSYQKEEFII